MQPYLDIYNRPSTILGSLFPHFGAWCPRWHTFCKILSVLSPKKHGFAFYRKVYYYKELVTKHSSYKTDIWNMYPIYIWILICRYLGRFWVTPIINSKLYSPPILLILWSYPPYSNGELTPFNFWLNGSNYPHLFYSSLFIFFFLSTIFS